MTIEEFIKTLDQTNPFFGALRDFLWREHLTTLYASKTKDLRETAMRLLTMRKDLLIDKRLKMVFGVIPGNQECLMAYLLQYHARLLKEPYLSAPEDQRAAADQYLKERHGYLILGIEGKAYQKKSPSYQHDEFDGGLLR